MTKIEAVQQFNLHILPSVGKDVTARRTAWNNFTDYLYKSKQINKRQNDKWCHPACIK